jgi:putative DNA primase/helicase
LPGILLWALEGLRRLYERGAFLNPERNKEMQARMARLASPVQAFLAECCLFDPNALIAKDTLYNRYCDWAERNEVQPEDKAHFGEAIIEAGRGRIKATKPREDGRQVPHYAGIRLAIEDPF